MSDIGKDYIDLILDLKASAKALRLDNLTTELKNLRLVVEGDNESWQAKVITDSKMYIYNLVNDELKLDFVENK
jgi:hypothetical protein